MFSSIYHLLPSMWFPNRSFSALNVYSAWYLSITLIIGCFVTTLICVINAKPHNSADSLIGLQSGRSIFNYSPKKSEKIQNFHEDSYSSTPAAMQRAILNYLPKVLSMSFYPDFIQILFRFYPYFILILSRFYFGFLKKLTLSKFYPDFREILSWFHLDKIWMKSG